MAMEEDQKEEIFQSPPEYQSRLSRQGSGSSAGKYIKIIIFIVVVVLIILGAFKFFSGGQNNKIDVTPTPTQEVLPTDTPPPSPTEGPSGTPSPSPKPTVNAVDKSSGLDRSKLSIHVLNGSGTAGASRKASDFLEGLGYNVIEMGNADNFNYEQTSIQVKSASDKYLSLLKKDLSASYTVGSASADLSSSPEKADAVVIIGKQ